MSVMTKGKHNRQQILKKLEAFDDATLERVLALLEKTRNDVADTENEDRAYLDYIRPVAESDVEGLLKAEKSYGNSWKQRSGIGAFMMLARKWDRIEKRVAKDISGSSGKAIARKYDIFEHIAADRRTEGIIDDIRDLRRYLMLVEAEMAARGVVKIGTSRDNIEESENGNIEARDGSPVIRYYFTPEAKEIGIDPPARAYAHDAGIDLRALYDYELAPGSITEVRTGMGFEIPNGYFGLICNRTSGGKKGILPLGHVVDAGYTGEVILILHNVNSDRVVHIRANERIAQMVVIPVLVGRLEQTKAERVKKTQRGKNRLGSSGSI